MDSHEQMRSNLYAKKGIVDYVAKMLVHTGVSDRQVLNMVGSLGEGNQPFWEAYATGVLQDYNNRLEHKYPKEYKYAHERNRWFGGQQHVNVAKAARLWGVSAPYARKLIRKKDGQGARREGREWYIRRDVAEKIKPFIDPEVPAEARCATSVQW